MIIKDLMYYACNEYVNKLLRFLLDFYVNVSVRTCMDKKTDTGHITLHEQDLYGNGKKH